MKTAMFAALIAAAGLTAGTVFLPDHDTAAGESFAVVQTSSAKAGDDCCPGDAGSVTEPTIAEGAACPMSSGTTAQAPLCDDGSLCDDPAKGYTVTLLSADGACDSPKGCDSDKADQAVTPASVQLLSAGDACDAEKPSCCATECDDDAKSAAELAHAAETD